MAKSMLGKARTAAQKAATKKWQAAGAAKKKSTMRNTTTNFGMKPETILRRAKEHKIARAKSRASLIKRLLAKTKESGADPMWKEMLRETLSKARRKK